ncbi:MAG: hypothetical protein AB1896_22345, partial [Thermodesulfobacteriota bacterium]
MDKVTVGIIGNLIDPLATREFRTVAAGRSVAEVLCELLPRDPDAWAVGVAVNGQPVPVEARAAWKLAAEDHLAVCAAPRGGGGDGKNPLATVAMLAVMVAAVYAGPAAAAAMGLTAGTPSFAVASSLVSAGVMIGGGMLVNAVLPAPALDLG